MSNGRLKYDHLWVERMQELPQYRPVVDKLLRGWSLGQITDWIMEQTDRGPLSNLKHSTVCTFLNALNNWIKENPRESRKKEWTRRAPQLTRLISDFTSGMTQGADVVAQQPGPTEEEIRSPHLSSMVDEITSGGLVRLALKKHLSHLDRLEEIEKQSKEPLNDWAPNIQVLMSIAAVLLKNETAQKLFEAQVQTRGPIPEPQLSEEAQRIAKLSALDRQLIRDAGEKFRILLKRRREERA